MNAHLSFKKTKLAAALLCVAQLSSANAAEPIFLNNAVQLDELVPVGRHQDASDTAALGEASTGAAYQQDMVIDSNNTVYSAYMDKNDGKAYVLKLVNNRWVAAATDDADGEVSTDELLAKDQSDNLIKKNRSMAMAISANDEPHLAYVASDGTVNVHKLSLDENGNGTEWTALPVITTDGQPQYLRFELASDGTPYILYGIATTKFANLTLVKLVDNAWVVQGAGDEDGQRTVTKVKVKTNFVEAGFALSPSDQPYLAFDNDTFGLDIDKIYVQKLEEVGENLVWTTVGSRKLTSTTDGVGNVRVVEMTIADDGVPYLLTGTHLAHQRLMVTKFTGENNETDDWEIVGSAINLPFQSSNFSSIIPDMKIKLDSAGVPYVIYQDFNSRPTSRTRVLRLEELLVDNELKKVWQQMDISAESLTSTTKTNLPHRYPSILFDSYDRPYVIYSDVGGNSKSRVLRAVVENNSEAMTFSVVEATNFAGKFDLELPGEGNVIDNVTLELSGRDADAFDADELAQGNLVLTAEDGAFFKIPSYSFTVSAVDNATNDKTAEIPVKVFFKPSDNDAIVADRQFAYETFLCDAPCQVNVNEDEEVFFEAIKSKIDYFELSGDLPEGVIFNLTDPEDPTDIEHLKGTFTGKTSFNSVTGLSESPVTAYPITITAFPIEGALDGQDQPAQPTAIDLVINVTNVEMQIDVADYSLTLNENVLYENIPDAAIAFERFTFEGVPSWAQENGLNGEITGTPNYDDAGVYNGKVFAHGFDGELEEYPFSIVVEQVDLALGDEAEQDLNHDENQGFNFLPDATAAHHFTISNKPDWALFDADLGEVTGKPSFTDEGDYSFTVTAYGHDEEDELFTTVNVTVDHVNAPPTINYIPSLVTEAEVSVSINVMEFVYDVDSAEYGDSVSFVMGADSYNHDGNGILEQVANGFIYTPSLDDIPQVTVTFTVIDDNSDESGPAESTGTFGIDVNFVEEKTFEQSSSAGSFGGGLLALFGLMFGIRSFKRKA